MAKLLVELKQHIADEIWTARGPLAFNALEEKWVNLVGREIFDASWRKVCRYIGTNFATWAPAHWAGRNWGYITWTTLQDDRVAEFAGRS